MNRVLILGSGPNAIECRAWDRAALGTIVAINNAWRVRPDWDVLIHPEDFPAEHRPAALRPGQRVVGARDYVPAQNAFGGFVYAGGTMAFTAAYWALHALAPTVMAFLGCDMVYPDEGPTHFYGTGTADPLRNDPTLQSLEAKSARLQVIASRAGCATVNLSSGESRLLFPRAAPGAPAAPVSFDAARVGAVLAREAELGYLAEDGRYWEREAEFDAAELRTLDAMWRAIPTG